MRRLVQIILFTPDVDALRTFYEEGMGLRPVYAGPNWTSYRTAGATLALHPLEGGHRQEIELTFDSPDVGAEVERFRNWGVHAASEVQGQPYGTTVQFRDPEGNLIALRTGGDRPGDAGPVLGTVILNVEDLDAAVAFYREHVGLAPAYVSPHWVEFDAGDVRLALHRRGTGLHHPLHAARPVAFTLETLDLESWVEELRDRDVRLATRPTEQDFGFFAEALDPDGNVVVLREVAPPEHARGRTGRAVRRGRPDAPGRHAQAGEEGREGHQPADGAARVPRREEAGEEAALGHDAHRLLHARRGARPHAAQAAPHRRREEDQGQAGHGASEEGRARDGGPAAQRARDGEQGEAGEARVRGAGPQAPLERTRTGRKTGGPGSSTGPPVAFSRGCVRRVRERPAETSAIRPPSVMAPAFRGAMRTFPPQPPMPRGNAFSIRAILQQPAMGCHVSCWRPY